MNSPELIVRNDSRLLPDPASSRHEHASAQIDWVGMGGINQPLLIRDGDQARQVQSKVEIYVDLGDEDAKGIHMSRLYLILDEHADTRPLSTAGLKLMLRSMLESHRGLSGHAYVRFEFDYFLRRSALVSDNSGWNAYPVFIQGELHGDDIVLELGVTVQYSSTCPCSAALARQLIQEQFDADFGAGLTAGGQIDATAVRAWLGTQEGIVATPHSQRSSAHVKVRLDDGAPDFPVTRLIDALEGTLKTPVQTAVKREDEQEFARLNGQNLMFIEDASRKLKAALDEDERFTDFWVRVEHHESLHAHDAVGVFTKGVEGGYRASPQG